MRMAVELYHHPMLVNAAVTLQDQFAYLGYRRGPDHCWHPAGRLAETVAAGTWDILLFEHTPYWNDPHELVRPLLVTDAPRNLGSGFPVPALTTSPTLPGVRASRSTGAIRTARSSASSARRRLSCHFSSIRTIMMQ